jgi:hypothetical protein
MIRFDCPHCGCKMEVEPDQAGQTLDCLDCGAEIIAPRRSTAAGKPTHCYRCGKKLRNRLRCGECDRVVRSQLCFQKHVCSADSQSSRRGGLSCVTIGCLGFLGVLVCLGLIGFLVHESPKNTATGSKEQTTNSDSAAAPLAKQRHRQPPQAVANFLARYGDPDEEDDRRSQVVPIQGRNILCIGWLLTYRHEQLMVYLAEDREWYFDLSSGKEIERLEGLRRLAGREPTPERGASAPGYHALILRRTAHP